MAPLLRHVAGVRSTQPLLLLQARAGRQAAQRGRAQMVDAGQAKEVAGDPAVPEVWSLRSAGAERNGGGGRTADAHARSPSRRL